MGTQALSVSDIRNGYGSNPSYLCGILRVKKVFAIQGHASEEARNP